MTHETTTLKTQAITSVPALAAAIRETHLRDFAVSTAQLCAPQKTLVQMYRVVDSTSAGKVDWAEAQLHEDARAAKVAEEAQSAAIVVGDVAERLRRLSTAYGEWKKFDAPAYFDIPQPQADLLLTVSERVSSVYVHFQMDLLLPSFAAAESYWANHFAPAYHAANIAHLGQDENIDENIDESKMRPFSSHKANGEHAANSLIGASAMLLPHNGQNVFAQDFWTEVQPAMRTRWQRLVAVIDATRRILADDIGYLTTNGAEDERSRYYAHWRRQPAPGLSTVLCPALEEIPTLSLTFAFPLPVHRQSGRLRRLRTNRDRNQRWRRQ